MIHNFQKLDQIKNEDVCVQDEKEIRKGQVMIKRLTCAIVLLLKENPMLPFGFKFNGHCLLEQLKKERDEFKM